MLTNPQFCIAYVIVDVFCIILTIIISANLQRDSGSETQVRYFYLLLAAYQAFLISDLVWAVVLFGGFFHPEPIVPALFNCINKVSVAATGFFWFGYGLARFENPLVYNKRARTLAALPVFLIIPLYFVGYAFDLNIVHTDNGFMSNGPIQLATSWIAAAYLIGATINAIIQYNRAESHTRRAMCLSFIAFMIAPAIGSIIDSIVPNLPIMAPCIMISIMLVMFSLQESRISGDALTGLNNRRRANTFLLDSVSQASESNPIYFFIIDMNRFKAINDTYGHLEGDHALQLMAAALKRSSSSLNAFAARWGGDEFVLICTHALEDDPKDVSQLIKDRLSEEARESGIGYDLTCSVGYAVCDAPTHDINALISAADEALYNSKKADLEQKPGSASAL